MKNYTDRPYLWKNSFSLKTCAAFAPTPAVHCARRRSGPNSTSMMPIDRHIRRSKNVYVVRRMCVTRDELSEKSAVYSGRRRGPYMFIRFYVRQLYAEARLNYSIVVSNRLNILPCFLHHTIPHSF